MRKLTKIYCRNLFSRENQTYRSLGIVMYRTTNVMAKDKPASKFYNNRPGVRRCYMKVAYEFCMTKKESGIQILLPYFFYS